MTENNARDEIIERIARQHCLVETLETRNSDSLDFHEVSIWGLKAALEEAFDAGKAHQIAKETPAPTPVKPSLLAELREAKAKSGQQKSTPTHHQSGPEL